MSPRRPNCATRDKILKIAGVMIHQRGFQAMSIGDLLEEVGISKGSLYHHFSSKQALGYAVFDEIYAPEFLADWQSIFVSKDPIQAMQSLFKNQYHGLSQDMLIHGCAVNNLAQEMSSIDDGFKQRINHIFTAWRTQLAQALLLGIQNNTVDSNIDPMRSASVIVASIQGAIGLAKNAQDLNFFHELLDGLANMLERLRPQASA